MKISLQQTLIFITALLSASTSASPVPVAPESIPDKVPADGTSAPHTAQGAAVINPGVKNGTEHKFASVLAQSQKCITFTADNPNWVYRNDGPWHGSGTFGSGAKRICVDRSDSAGGAMFIGIGPGPAPAGTTKLECFFPTHGTANCDASLVDGYSLSVACNTASRSIPTIGGSTNLWKTGAGCNDLSMFGQGVCKNNEGYKWGQDAVTPFFKQAVTNGNNYCVWANCNQDYFFNVEEDLSCHISGGQWGT